MKTITGQTFSEFQSFAGLENTIFRHCKFLAGMEAEGCKAVRWEDCQFSGGRDNVRLCKCEDCILIGGTYADPTGGLPDPLDPETHHALLDDCDCCEIQGGLMSSEELMGDAINLYNSRHCQARGCTINSRIAKKGTAAIVDGPNGHHNEISKLIIKSQTRVGIAGGSRHVLKDLDVPDAVEVSARYKDTKVEGCKIWRVRSPILFIGKRVVNLQQRDCKFDKVEA